MENKEHSPARIMCIYAMSDEPFYLKLQTYLRLWQREGAIEWLETPAGSDIEQTLHAHLKLADLILLLISPDFFAEDRSFLAMKVALQEQAKRNVPVVPILTRASAWKKSICGGVQALPDDELPTNGKYLVACGAQGMYFLQLMM